MKEQIITQNINEEAPTKVSNARLYPNPSISQAANSVLLKY